MSTDHRIDQPIFILGPERSGTTLLYSVLANADEFYWFSRIDSVLPSRPWVASVVRKALQILQPNVHAAEYKKISSMKGLVTPSECIPYWRNVFGWGDEEDYLVEDDFFSEADLTLRLREEINGDFGKRLEYSGKSRLLFKQPGFSMKISFWDALYSDALFIICTRRIVDNVRSLVSAKSRSDVNFWGTKVPGWRTYLKADERTQSLYQLQQIYKVMLESVDQRETGNRVIVVPYESLVMNSGEICRRVTEFCNVNWNSAMEESLNHIVKPDQILNEQTDVRAGNTELLDDYLYQASRLLDEARTRNSESAR